MPRAPEAGWGGWGGDPGPDTPPPTLPHPTPTRNALTPLTYIPIPPPPTTQKRPLTYETDYTPQHSQKTHHDQHTPDKGCTNPTRLPKRPIPKNTIPRYQKPLNPHNPEHYPLDQYTPDANRSLKQTQK
ncbi:Hypothetical predicted protein [Pelobates cultripes]|uniref:Uncharacterized protein n=1 Tax=Pelobates cultripes TaxID=61616 RepID=A0AAD1W8F5_PELCU|nr:Hypothetical predicted protein [Pelobates cultripes]